MPSSAEYQDAIRILEGAAKDEAAFMACSGQADTSDAYTLALCCLRVVAAMEAGTLRLIAPQNGGDLWCAMGEHNLGMRCYAPDPLTTAERAMGVGNG